ncbi:hypothetical protein ElyMa_001801300 [Elysia marginata]|uniref:Uncharacterized protein n=1 Tax=Elysia marginata TaxID=1093978 RepID=A0AAV4EFZ0_9GAST|nr:hypothetical protein ElyMa_001801300 [Elysia marginata]
MDVMRCDKPGCVREFPILHRALRTFVDKVIGEPQCFVSIDKHDREAYGRVKRYMHTRATITYEIKQKSVSTPFWGRLGDVLVFSVTTCRMECVGTVGLQESAGVLAVIVEWLVLRVVAATTQVRILVTA